LSKFFRDWCKIKKEATYTMAAQDEAIALEMPFSKVKISLSWLEARAKI